MAKATGFKIEDLDYNTVRNEIVKVLGVGSGKFGYGQPIMSSPVARNMTITATQWNNLRYDIYNARLHQDGSPPSLTQVTQGGAIDYTTTTPASQFNAATVTAVANKFNLGAGQFVLQPGINKSRTSPWSSKLSAKVTVSFNTADQARWFFNSGGQIRFSSSRTGGSVTNQTQNNYWTNLLNTVGIVSFSATSPLDFYELTNQYTNLYTSPASATQTSDNLVCISVCDESSPAASTIRTDWLTFRSNYPNRPFYLLQPTGYSASALSPPAEFTADPKATGPITVNRDNGNVVTASDWYTICNVSQVPDGGKIALSVDNSGSMTTDQVRASIAMLESKCALRGISIIRLDMGTSERWAVPFNAAIIATSDYSSNRYEVNARCNVPNNSNGGATVIEFEINWEDNYNNLSVTGTDEIDGTLNLIVDELRAQGTLQPSGQFTITRPTYAISDIIEVGPVYSITASTAAVDEGGTVIFNVATANVPNSTVTYWTARPISGSINANDFTDGILQGTLTITNNAAAISRTLNLDSATEGVESFEMILRTGSHTGPIVAKSTVVTVRDTSITPTYSIVPSTTSVNESGSVTFNVATTGVAPGTILYWTTALTTVASANDIVCISVCDESSVGTSTNQADWVAFRNNYPNRPFYLLQPGGGSGYITVQSSNYNQTQDPINSFIAVNGTKVSYSPARGHTVAVFNPTSLVLESIATYDTYGANNSTALLNALTAIPNGKLVAIGSFDATAFDQSTRNYVNSVFKTTAPNTWAQARVSHIIIGIKNGTLPAYEGISTTATINSGNFNIPGANQSLMAIPTAFTTDPKAVGPIPVNRDNGSSANASDWYTICNLDQVPNGSKIALSIDNSGSMTSSTVQASINLLTTKLSARGITIVSIPMNSERWAQGFNTAIALPTITSITGEDFTDNVATGSVVIGPSGTGSFIRGIKEDILSEGAESFLINLRTGSVNGPIVAVSVPVTINDTSLTRTYSVVTGTTTVYEGNSVTFNVTTSNVPNGLALYWTTLSTQSSTDAADFTDNTTTGTVVINGNAGTIVRTLRANEGNATPNDKFKIQLRLGSITGPIVATSNEVEIIDVPEDLPPTYAVAPNVSGVNEGSSVTFNVTTTNIPNGTVLYWTISGVAAADFTDSLLSGSVTMNNNTAAIVRTLSADFTSEGTETFTLYIRTGSTSGPIVATSSSVVVNDTSLTQSYTVSASTSSVTEGDSVTFYISTTNVPTGTTLYWSVLSVQNSTNSSDFTDNTMSGSFIVSNNAGTVVRTLRANEGDAVPNDQFRLQVRTGSTSGPIVALSPVVEIVDNPEDLPKTYLINASTTSVNEGSSVTFTATTTNIVNGTTLYWTASGVSGADFTDGVTSGSFVVYSNTGTVTTRIISTDALTEGTESFYVSLRTGSTGGPIVANSQSVTINDTSLSPPTYAISRSTAIVSEGNAVTFNVTTTNIPNGTVLYWSTTGGVANYYSNGVTDPAWSSLLNTYCIWQGNGTYTYSVYFPTSTTYVFSASIDNYGTVYLNGAAILDVPTYSTVYSTSRSVSAGWHTVTLTGVNTGGPGGIGAIITQGSASGPIIWTTRSPYNANEVVTTNGSDFTDNLTVGTVTINSNSGTIVRTLRNDLSTEGSENFSLALRTGSYSGTIVAISGPVTVNDTSVNASVTCISVIDESSPAASTLRNDWISLRNNYPGRPFYLLYPPPYGVSALQVPAEYYTDPAARGPFQVNRDNGSTAARSDWFTICGLSALPAGSKVAIAIDGSGSMTLASVQASYNYFMTQCQAAGLNVIVKTMYDERWALPFNTAI